MKKIVLGCAAVLLSIGLLAGCGNKEDEEPPIAEAVTISVDSSATVVVGESLELSYTVSPEKAEVIAACDNQDVVTAVAQSGTLYLEGVAEGSAIVTLVGTYEGYATANKNINVSVVTEATEKTEPGTQEPEPVITLTGIPEKLDLIESGSSETIVPVVTPAEADIEYEITEVEFTTEPEPAEGAAVITVTPTGDGYEVAPAAQGTANIVFTASLAGYDDVTATTAVTVHEAGWEPQSLTYKITLDSLGAAPADTVLYAAGDFNGTWNPGNGGDGWYDWGEPVELEANEDATYNLVLDFLPENNRSFEILATNPTYDNNAEEDRWEHVIGSYTIADITDASNGTTIAITISTEYDCWEDSDEGNSPVFKALGADETIYVVFLDSSSDDKKVADTAMSVGTYTVVDNKGNATFKEGATSCTPTMATTTQSRVAFYTEEVTVPAYASVEFDLYVTNNSVTYHETSPDLTVPEAESGKTNVLVLGPWFDGWLSASATDGAVWWTCNFSSTSGYESSGLGWLTMDSGTQISEFVSSISYTYSAG